MKQKFKKPLDMNYVAGLIDAAAKFVAIKITPGGRKKYPYPSFLIRIELRWYDKNLLDELCLVLGGKVADDHFLNKDNNKSRLKWSISNDEVKVAYEKLKKYIITSHEKFTTLIDYLDSLETIKFIKPEERANFIKKQLKKFDEITEKMKSF